MNTCILAPKVLSSYYLAPALPTAQLMKRQIVLYLGLRIAEMPTSRDTPVVDNAKEGTENFVDNARCPTVLYNFQKLRVVSWAFPRAEPSTLSAPVNWVAIFPRLNLLASSSAGICLDR